MSAGAPSWIKEASACLHRLAAVSRFGSRCHLALCRLVAARLPVFRQRQLLNSLAGVRWPEAALRPQTVVVGKDTEIRLYPHNGESDFAAVLGGDLEYEEEVFKFLDARAAVYDVVVEIGANVGLFTLYFGRQLFANGGRVYAFEPSRQAFSRLLSNLDLNALPNVFPINAAVGAKTGFEEFHEPEGHLTNGSLVGGFAAKFSESVRSVPVLVVDAALLHGLVKEARRVLIKIDVEGYEAQVLRALAPLVASKRPDILLEVLPEFEVEIGEAVLYAAPGYEMHAITAQGLQRQSTLKAVGGRDCFLTPESGLPPAN